MQKAMQRSRGTIHRLQAELTTPQRTVRCCQVCGSREVRTDEVVERGFLLLAECRHCDHRWTRPLPDAAAASRPVASVRPAAPAHAAGAAGGQGAEVATAA